MTVRIDGNDRQTNSRSVRCHRRRRNRSDARAGLWRKNAAGCGAAAAARSNDPPRPEAV